MRVERGLVGEKSGKPLTREVRWKKHGLSVREARAEAIASFAVMVRTHQSSAATCVRSEATRLEKQRTERSRIVFCPSILPKNALVFCRTEDFELCMLVSTIYQQIYASMLALEIPS